MSDSDGGVSQEYHLCEVVTDWDDGMDAENLDERKCVNEAVGKFRFETHGGLECERWLCQGHRDEFDAQVVNG